MAGRFLPSRERLGRIERGAPFPNLPRRIVRVWNGDGVLVSPDGDGWTVDDTGRVIAPITGTFTVETDDGTQQSVVCIGPPPTAHVTVEKTGNGGVTVAVVATGDGAEAKLIRSGPDGDVDIPAHSGIDTVVQPGAYTYILTCTDQWTRHRQAEDGFIFSPPTVTAPTALRVPYYDVYPGFAAQVVASGDLLTFGVVDDGSGMLAVDAGTGAITLMSSGFPGHYTATFTAENQDGTALLTCAITVVGAPEVTPPPTSYWFNGRAASITFTCDQSAPFLAYQTPTGWTLDPDTGTWTGTATSTNNNQTAAVRVVNDVGLEGYGSAVIRTADGAFWLEAQGGRSWTGYVDFLARSNPNPYYYNYNLFSITASWLTVQGHSIQAFAVPATMAAKGPYDLWTRCEIRHNVAYGTVNLDLRIGVRRAADGQDYVLATQAVTLPNGQYSTFPEVAATNVTLYPGDILWTYADVTSGDDRVGTGYGEFKVTPT